MALLTLKVMAGLLQLQGTGAQIQSDHQGLNALLLVPLRRPEQHVLARLLTLQVALRARWAVVGQV